MGYSDACPSGSVATSPAGRVEVGEVVTCVVGILGDQDLELLDLRDLATPR